MKILKTVKGKLLSRILLVVIIGIIAIGSLGSFLNFFSTQSTLETTLSKIAVRTRMQMQN